MVSVTFDWPGAAETGLIELMTGTLPVPLTANAFAEEGEDVDAPAFAFTTTICKPVVALDAILTLPVKTVPAGLMLKPASVNLTFASGCRPPAVDARNCTLVAPSKLLPLIVMGISLVFEAPVEGVIP